MEFLKPTKPKLILTIFLTGFAFLFLSPYSSLQGEPAQCYGKGSPIEGYCILIAELAAKPLRLVSFFGEIIVCYLISCVTVFLIYKLRG